MIVIDVGCARYGGDYSIERLVEKFDPDILYGFDPAWEDGMYIPVDGRKTKVIVSRDVAWVNNGEVHFLEDGLNGQVGNHSHWPEKPCFDLALFMRGLPVEDELILKLDCEGSEYALLERLMRKGVDQRLSLAWVEWHPIGTHDPARHRKSIEDRIQCQIDEWLW